jgi:WxcM-like, C-terminal
MHRNSDENMNLSHCKILDFPKIPEPRGNLSFIEGGRHVPFDIARVYYLYDVPGGESRGGHAHKALFQVIIAINGSFDVELDDGLSRKTVRMCRANQGLYIVPGIWRELTNFSSGSVCLVLASMPYIEEDYFRDYPEFLEAVGRGDFNNG